MTDVEKAAKVIVLKDPREGIFLWWDPPQMIFVPGRPELGLLPAQLNVYNGDDRSEPKRSAGLSYFPELRTFRSLPESSEVQMKYRSVHNPKIWLVLTASRDGSMWKAEKRGHGKMTAFACGRPGNHFMAHFALIPITMADKPATRVWADEKAAAVRKAAAEGPALEPEEENWDIPRFCR